jgi:hypothetical protein
MGLLPLALAVTYKNANPVECVEYILLEKSMPFQGSNLEEKN